MPSELMHLKIFDLHNDTFTELYDKKTTLSDGNLAVNVSGVNKYNRFIGSFAVWLSGSEKEPFLRYQNVLNNGKKQLISNNIKICYTASDLLNRSNRQALLSLEGGAVIDSTQRISDLYNDGIRTISLTWNYDNHLAGGALGDGSLTSFGIDVINCINRYNIAFDMSHLNRKSFFKALEFAKFPIVTHAGLDYLVPNKRNLTDEQVRLIAIKGGIIGLCFYADFIGKSVEDGFLRAVYNLLSKGYEDNIAIGSDFDGAKMDSLPQNLSETTILYKKCINLFGQKVCDKLFFTNSYNFYVNVLTNQ